MDRDKKIGIIYNGLTGYGGVQVCVIQLIKALNSIGVIPYLITDIDPNIEIINNEGLNLKIKKVNYNVSKSTMEKYNKVLNPIREFVYYFKTSWLKKEFDFIYFFQFNIIIDDETKHLGYLSNSPITPHSPNPFIHRSKHLFYKIFIRPFLPIFEFQRYNAVINSKFTSDIFFEEYGKRLEVVYPPNTMAQTHSGQKWEEKTCISLSRISPLKNTNLVLDLAILHPDYYFFIVGGLAESDREYLGSIQQRIDKANIRNVEISANAKYSTVLKLLLKSQYYLFFGEVEHFGITTVEAIMCNCIPFVHNSGGQKEIVPFDDYRFDFEDMEAKFSDLIHKPIEEKVKKQKMLLKHMDKFKTEEFTNRLIEKLDNKIA